MNDSRFAAILRQIGAPPSAPPLPDPAVVWWRAQLRSSLTAEDRALRPIRIAERLACAALALAAVVLIAVR